MIGCGPRRIGKGFRRVFEGNDRGILAWLGTAVLGMCLVFGCAERPSAVDLYLDAVMLRELGQEEAAARQLKAAVTQDPDFVLAHSELGRAYLALNELELAAEAFRQAARLDLWSFQDHMDLATVYEKLGRFDEAARVFARAGELDTESLEAQLAAARCYLNAERAVQALVHCELARQIDAESEEALRLLARAYEMQKDYEQAARLYEELLKDDPKRPESLLALAMAHMRGGRYGRARDVLLGMIQNHPDRPQAFRHLGYCFLKLGEADQAVAMYERAIALDDGDWEAHRGLGVACMIEFQRSGDEAMRVAALRHWRRSLDIHPDQPRRDWLKKLIQEHALTENPLRGLDD